MVGVDTNVLGRLRQLYLVQLKERLVTLEKAMADLQNGFADQAHFDALEFEAHKLHGTGATYGFTDIGDAAEILEVRLHTGERDPKAITVLLATLIMAVQQSLHEGRQEAAAALEVEAAEQEVRNRPGYKPTVLVADDDPSILNFATQLLSSLVNVECVSTGQAAIEAVTRRRYDLVILDCGLPDMTGLDVLKRIVRSDRGTASPVMMLTAVRDPARVSQLIAAGAHHYLVKPIAPTQFVERVMHVIRRQRKIVMVVDDDPLIRESFRRKLSQRGHEVVLATNGAQALNLVQQIHPQAIVLDRAMPRMDGIQVLQQLRRKDDTRAIPVVMLSARSSGDDIHTGYSEGADAYMVKPFLPDQVIDCCENLLQSRGPAQAAKETPGDWAFV